MQRNEYDLMRDVQSQHWWWLGRERLLREVMDTYLSGNRKDTTIADVGCGFGANIPLLSQYGTVYALESDATCLEHVASTTSGVKQIQWESPAPVNHAFDAMLLADVLEHIDDDHATLKWISDHLKPNGYAFITVPAHMYLWTEMDDVVHHHRRYSLMQLSKLVGHGMVIEKISYYNAILYPVKILFVLLTKALRRILPDREKQSYNDLPPGPINYIFKAIMCAEAKLIKRFSLPFGVSLIMVVRKLPETEAH